MEAEGSYFQIDGLFISTQTNSPCRLASFLRILGNEPQILHDAFKCCCMFFSKKEPRLAALVVIGQRSEASVHHSLIQIHPSLV
jgi:hypothetical protein